GGVGSAGRSPGAPPALSLFDVLQSCCRRCPDPSRHPWRTQRAGSGAVTDVIKPRDGKEVEEAVKWALAHDKALEVAGRGSKRAIGRPSQTDLTLELSALAGVTLYEPEELVLSAKAGTPIAEIEQLLQQHNQELAFEPLDYGPLLG